MKMLEMENHEEIVLLLIKFFEDNNNYSKEDVNKFIEENEILNGIDPDEVFYTLEQMKEYKEKGLIVFNEEELEDYDNDIDDYEYEEEFEYEPPKKKPIFRELNKQKKLNLKEPLKFIKHNFVILGKWFLLISNKSLKFLLEKIIKLGNYILNKKVNISKQILLYKKITQKELDGAKGDLIKADEQRKADYEKIILKLTRRDKVIPRVNIANMLKFALKGILHDIKVLLIYIAYCYIVVKINVFKYGLGLEFGIYTLFFIGGFLLLYSIITIFKIKKLAEDSVELQDFLWEDFKYGNGLVTSFHDVFDNRDYNEEDFEDMSKELESMVDDTTKIEGKDRKMEKIMSNEYEKALKEWNNKHFKEGEIIPLPIAEKDKNEYITKFSFEVPTELELDVVERKIPEYARYCKKTILHDEKSIKDSKITLFIEEKEMPTMVKFSESRIIRGSDTKVYIGEAFDGSVYLDFNDNPHMLIGGSSGCGKGVTQNVILTQLTQKGEVIIMDLSTKAGADYSYYRDKGYRIVTQLEETLELFKGLQEEARIRMEIFRRYGKNKLSAYNKAVSEEEKIYRKFIIIDEYASLKRVDKEDEDEAKEIEKTIIALGEQARAVGIHIIIATQNAKATIINTELRNNLLLRVVGRCADFNASNVFLENDFASVKKDVPLIKSHETGRFIVSGANTKDRLAMNEHFVVQVPYMEFAGDNAEEHIRKYGYLVEEPKVSKIIERYRKGEEKPIEQITNTDNQTHNTFEEKTAKDYL